jgi:hypothetical protein
VTLPSEGWNGSSATSTEPDENPELRELEEELRRLGGVVGVRVVGDRLGRPVEVHVVSDHTKHAKQTVRDVRAVAQTVFGIEIDHRIVSVAQLDAAAKSSEVGDDLIGSPDDLRARVSRVHVDSEGLRSQVRVVVTKHDREHTGYAEGSIASVARPQLVASATLDAVRQIDAVAEGVHLASADIVRSGQARVAIVTVVFVEPPVELQVSGSAVVRQDRDDAVARALLDAMNRRLNRKLRTAAQR